RKLIAYSSFILLSFLSVPAYPQYDNNWYFGRKAGLNFNVSAGQQPQALTNGMLISTEASAAISNENGQLLFYTNGVEVYDKNHMLMINGDNLGGNISACQMSIVPMPGDPNLFYIFSADAFENDYVNGYRYSIVDMSLGGGDGAVTSKNNLLWSSCSERMATVRHSNGVDVWLITNDFESNIFRAWLIDCSGLQPTPVVSTLGAVMNMHALANVGVLKASPDGNMLCQTHFPGPGFGSSNFIQLFDFDNTTGVLSNVKNISLPTTRYNHCEFSPNSQFLYLTRKEDMQLDQLEVTLPTVADIVASRVSFPTVNSYYDIQLAVNEKIYLTQSNSLLAVINYPDQKGNACGFQRDVLDLTPGSAAIGLPSHINDIVGNSDNGFDYSVVDNCTGEVQFNASTTLPATLSWQWDFGDGNFSNVQNPVHSFTDPTQVYRVKLTITSTSSCGKISRSRNIHPAGFVKPTLDFDFVNVCDSGYIRFINKTSDLQQPGTSFLWEFDDGNTSTDIHPTHIYSGDDTYDVKLKIITGSPCFDDFVSKPVEVKTFSINTLPGQTISFGESITLTTTGPPANYTWIPATWLNSPTSKSPVARPRETILYKVSATDANGCYAEDTVTITVKPPEDVDDIYVPRGFTPNNDGRNDLMRPFIPKAYRLQEFSIFNRWGQRIFMSADKWNGWNGKLNEVPQDPGAYVWVVKAIDSRNGKVHERKGTFILIR
ncbi:MAG TPA: PKD domain-containing protein, partial [Chitinophagaceae bacterium]|nr:PKD domain-containing protein [Chitinophagaceae bacterium]